MGAKKFIKRAVWIAVAVLLVLVALFLAFVVLPAIMKVAVQLMFVFVAIIVVAFISGVVWLWIKFRKWRQKRGL